MINLKKDVLLEWLPNSDYTQLSLPGLEVYFEGDMTSDSYQSELWIPIKIKEESTNQGGEYDSI
ncbi:GyrI-like domain-containing protein [uncultured Vagococcus sp.]|uniref:GyrI-like domain-containing protein n=1 Tax=uncultured Vagococcus sp. TaxID=189676 RepID=UPI0028D895D5|nr:GyrI-like domain-containing protein [uncultured Vagococcus sp.]